MPMLRFTKFLSVLAFGLLASQVSAQEDAVPYWASLTVDKANMRVGPADTYKIDWVYVREGLPVKVLRREGGWRLIEDPDGARGWMMGRFLSRERTVIVKGKGLAEMRAQASAASRLLWRMEPGVVVKLGECADGWCAVELKGNPGFVLQNRLWGAGEP